MRNNQRLFLLWISAALFAAAPLGAGAQVDVLTYRYDNMRSGANLKETVLKKSNVNKTKFGKLAFRNVDGNIYAQPLVVTKAKVVGRAAATNLAIVATEHNSVYAFDADDTSADPPGGQSAKALWHTESSVLGESVRSQEIYDQIGAPGCADLTTEVGITGTPVIKLRPGTTPKEGVIFVAAKSKSGATQYTYTLFALNLTDGKLLGPGAAIEGEVSVGARTISFDPLHQLNRPALLLDQNTLYIAFGGHCDAGDYRGGRSPMTSLTRAPPESSTSSPVLSRNGKIIRKAGGVSGCPATVCPWTRTVESTSPLAMAPTTLPTRPTWSSAMPR